MAEMAEMAEMAGAAGAKWRDGVRSSRQRSRASMDAQKGRVAASVCRRVVADLTTCTVRVHLPSRYAPAGC